MSPTFGILCRVKVTKVSRSLPWICAEIWNSLQFHEFFCLDWVCHWKVMNFYIFFTFACICFVWFGEFVYILIEVLFTVDNCKQSTFRITECKQTKKWKWKNLQVQSTDQKIVLATSTLAGDLFSEVHQIETIININLAKMPNLKWKQKLFCHF